MRRKFSLIPSSFIIATISVCAMSASVYANDDPWDLSIEELGKLRTTTMASGLETPLDKAAAVVTVITAEDILSMGASDLDQVLETVPGLHINHSEQAMFPKYIFRGISTHLNGEALFLINDVPITSFLIGNRGNVWGGFPVKSISRIEVIRGPGSALYGAEAFAGVINIKTKGNADITDNVGLRVGTNQTKGAWLETGHKIDQVDIGFIFEHQQTDGWKGTIDHDQQTNFDEQFNTDASLAPDTINTGASETDMRIEVSGEQWKLHSGYQIRSDIETGPGLGQALDPNGRFASRRFNADYQYNVNNVGNAGLDISIRTSYYRATQEVEEDILIFPQGAFGGAFPNGFIGNPEFKEEQARADISALYRGFSSHRIHLGTGYLWGDVYETSEAKNFCSFCDPTLPPVDVSNIPSEVYFSPKDRKNLYALLQDEWDFNLNWTFTSGVRYDHYSDFGDTFNPRLALVWASTHNITTKLLYGRAFRAPSLAELYVVNNPVNVGNSQLTPETIDTYELAFTHYVSTQLQYNANTYYYDINDLIIGQDDLQTPNDPRLEFVNAGKQKGYGLEFDITYHPNKQLKLLANYAFQRAIDKTNNKAVGEAPNHQIYGRAEWRFQPTWLITTQANWVGEQKRIASDTRPPVDDYLTIDLTVRKQKLFDNATLSVSIRNLLDTDAEDPSPWAFPTPSIPNDFPLAGRSAVAEFSIAL